MLKLSLCLMTIVLIATSCLKDSKSDCYFSPTTAVAPQAEQDSLKSFLDSMGLAATKDASGFYYEITADGAADKAPELCSYITVTYTGKLTNGNTFDQNTGVQFQLGRVIDGWKRGIPLIKKGGRIKLYIPPSLGYGNVDLKDNSGVVLIPAKSILLFDVTLDDYTAGN
jgi:FKBP-type peptidyl-prolyl cis-trans isomerase FkpA